MVAHFGLKIENNSSAEITECYATLEVNKLIPINKIEAVGANIQHAFGELSQIRLRWKNPNQSQAECKISIAPKPGFEILRVIQSSTWFSLIPTANPGFRKFLGFDHCGNHDSSHLTHQSLPYGLYMITVRVDGKKDGKSIKPVFFKGYFYIGAPQYAIPPFSGGPIPDTVMFIRQGNPMKDKDIPSSIKTRI